MEEELLSKKEIKKLMSFKGKIRGIDIKADREFILKKEGKEGLKKVEEKLRAIGVEIEYEKIKSMEFYPGGLKALSLLAMKAVFNYSDEEISEIGKFNAKFSLILKIFMKFFGPPEKFFFNQTPKIWERYWTEGRFVPVQYNEKEKWAIARYEELDLHPIYCHYLRGYFTTLAQLVTGSKNVEIREEKCSFLGDKFHEYLIKWK